MTWSRISRLQLPTHLSAVPFCQGACTLVRLAFSPVASRKVTTSSPERRISIEDGISIRTRFGESLAQLLDHPLRCRVVSHVEVQNPTPPVLDHEKAIEQLECHCRHREKVERGDHLAMIL